MYTNDHEGSDSEDWPRLRAFGYIEADCGCIVFLYKFS